MPQIAVLRARPRSGLPFGGLIVLWMAEDNLLLVRRPREGRGTCSQTGQWPWALLKTVRVRGSASIHCRQQSPWKIESQGTQRMVAGRDCSQTCEQIAHSTDPSVDLSDGAAGKRAASFSSGGAGADQRASWTRTRSAWDREEAVTRACCRWGGSCGEKRTCTRQPRSTRTPAASGSSPALGAHRAPSLSAATAA